MLVYCNYSYFPYAECCSAMCHYAVRVIILCVCRYSACHCAECLYAECQYDEYRYAVCLYSYVYVDVSLCCESLC